MKYTQELFSPRTDGRIISMREDALKRGIPVMDDETLSFLITYLSAVKPKNILEIGTAVGLSAAAMLMAAEDSRATTIEVEEERYLEAKENLLRLGLKDRCECLLGDAGDILNMMEGKFDFVFLDGPKAQYLSYLPDIKRLMNKGATLLSDDVLLFGWVNGEAPHKRQSIVNKIKEYLKALSKDEELMTTILEVGDGIAVSVKIN